MFITVVNNLVVHRCPSISEIANSLRTLGPTASASVEVFELVGDGNDILMRLSGSETGEGITPANLEKYRRRYP